MVFSANEDWGCVGCEKRDRKIKKLGAQLKKYKEALEEISNNSEGWTQWAFRNRADRALGLYPPKRNRT